MTAVTASLSMMEKNVSVCKAFPTSAVQLDPAVGERMERHFKDGAFYFDLGGNSYPFFEGNTVYTVVPHFAEQGSEGIVKKRKRLMEKDLKEKESET